MSPLEVQMQRVYEFYRQYPATVLCPTCGQPSRLVTAVGGECLSCTLGWHDSDDWPRGGSK